MGNYDQKQQMHIFKGEPVHQPNNNLEKERRSQQHKTMVCEEFSQRSSCKSSKKQSPETLDTEPLWNIAHSL